MPYGALGWIQRGNRLQIDTEKNSLRDNTRTFQPDTTYNLKMRVETIGTDSLYSLKVWELGQSEPLDWDLQQNESLSGPGLQNGSLLLVAHRQDASFSEVNITPL